MGNTFSVALRIESPNASIYEIAQRLRLPLVSRSLNCWQFEVPSMTHAPLGHYLSVLANLLVSRLNAIEWLREHAICAIHAEHCFEHQMSSLELGPELARQLNRLALPVRVRVHRAGEEQ